MEGRDRPIRGRDGELARIGRLLDAVAGGASRVALVTGPSGVGRSRLLAEIARAGPGRGFTTLVGDPRTPPEVEAWLRMIERRGGAGRYLLVVDDADGLEPGVVEALLPLVGPASAVVKGRAPVLLVLAWKTCEAGSELDVLLEAPPPEREHIPLAPLSPDAVARMATDALGVEPQAGVMALCAEASGNAVLVQALLSGLAEERPAAPGLVPARVQRLLRHRMAKLSAKGRQLVRTVAATDAGCSVARLTTILGENVVNLLPAFEESVESGLLSFSRDGIDVRYPLVRRVVRSWLPGPLLEALRAEVGDVPAGAHTALGELPPPRLPPVRVVPPRGRAEPAAAAWEEFSETERAVAALAARGLTNRQIGREVYLSPHTVNYHLRRIFRKLNVSSRVELAGIAAFQHPRSPSLP